jgi:hypothetical protein
MKLFQYSNRLQMKLNTVALTNEYPENAVCSILRDTINLTTQIYY